MDISELLVDVDPEELLRLVAEEMRWTREQVNAQRETIEALEAENERLREAVDALGLDGSEVVVVIARPDEYDDVCHELVLEDFIDSKGHAEFRARSIDARALRVAEGRGSDGPISS